MPWEPRALSRDEVRRVDERAIADLGLPGIVLMENAGRNAADWLMRRGIGGRVVVCAGRGNNGGDGSVMARHLANAGVDVGVLLFGDPASLRGDALIAWNVFQKAGGDCRAVDVTKDAEAIERDLRGADWIVDALLGTGVRGPVREPDATAIDLINAAHRNVLAIDLPSGLDADKGVPLGSCVKATATVTFVARKRGFDVSGSAKWTGEVHVADIGAPVEWLRGVIAPWDAGG